jgi:peptidoglycan L-alanyl-D-glutamate endopeptidase CwlK
MNFKLGAQSEKNLIGVHPDLVLVVREAIKITDIDFKVIEGCRTLERQVQLVKIGASQTMNSRHLTGHAVDLAALYGGKVAWDWPLYYVLGDCVKEAARRVSIPIEWGGDWKLFKDGPHWQLPWREYPI